MKRSHGLFGAALSCLASIALATGVFAMDSGGNLNVHEDWSGYLRGIETAQTEAAEASVRSASAMQANAAETTITATGELNVTKRRGESIYLYFQVPSTVTQITSAKVKLNAYDVDYPSATEHDKVYFNGTYIGSLQGYNNGWEWNSFDVPANLVTTGENTMRIHVDADQLGWVTQVNQVTLTLNASTASSGNVTLTASTELVNKIQLNWVSTVQNTTYNIYRGTKSDQLTLLVEKTSATSYTDTSVTGGQTYYYQIMTVNGGVSSAIATGKYLVPSLTLQTSGDLYNKVEITWTAKNCTTPYMVYRGATAADAADPSKRTQVASGLTATSFIDSKVTGGQTYYYQVVDSIGTTSTAVSGTSKAAGTLLTETSGGATWTYFKTGSDVTVYGVSGSTASDLTVPETLGGCPVREIEYRAFAGLSVRNLYLPTTLARLCRGAFAGATNLTGLYFLGDKPTFDAKALEGTSASLAVFVRAGASGWATSGAARPTKLTTGDGTSRNLRHCWTVNVLSPEHGTLTGATSGWHPADTVLKITAKPASRYLLLRWTGDLTGCTISGNEVSVPVTCDRTIGAEFTEDVYPPTLEPASGEKRLEWSMVVGESRDAAYVVSNPFHGTQSGLEVSVIGCPTNCQLTYAMPTTVAADSETMLTFRAKALEASPSAEWETFTIRVTTAEGGSIDIPAAFHAVSERARLLTVEDKLVTTMAIGEHTEVSFTLVNDTGVESGRIHLNLTNYGWLSLVGPKILPSLGPGESRTVTLALDPAEDGEWSQSFAYEGNVTFTCEQGTGGDIDFAFTPVTDKKGSVRVVCKDNLGEGATYVAFAGATVSLLDAATLNEVASGTSDANGVCTLPDLAVGRYVIGVMAKDHDSYKAVIYVRAGQQTEVRALMSVAIVTGRAEFKWIEIEDEYVLVYTPQIVHVVPAPNVEWDVDPRTLAEGDTTIVQMHVKNVGLVKATSVTFAFPAYPAATHHIQFSANGFSLDPNEERDVTVRFVCDDPGCTGTGINRAGYATMKVGYTSSDPETGETRTVGYCDGKLVLHGNVPEPEYELPTLVFTTPENTTGDKRTYDPDYELLNSGRVIFKQGSFESDGTVKWPKKPRPDAVVPVTLEIRQPVALKRDVIEGSFVFSNKSETAEAYVHLDLEIVNAAGDDCRNLFTIVATNTANDGSVPLDGDKLIANEVTLDALREGRAGFWFVPTRAAAPTVPVDYYFGGSFIYRIGKDGTPQTNDLMLCKMTVSPMPFLKMDYFTQRDVFSDNPFTDVVEAYQPAEFALRVRNEGGGAAKNVRISSYRPEIITNESNLVVDYDLRNWSYASYLDGTSKTLDLDEINLGTIAAGATTVAEWLFVSTLEGHFTTNGHARLEYTMPWQNSNTTQISEDIGVHLMIHRVDADGDGIVDFLTSERSVGGPDRLWRSSEADSEPINAEANLALAEGDGTMSGAQATVVVELSAEESGYAYGSMVLDDARNYRVSRVERADGSAVPLDNVWTTDRTFVSIDLDSAFGSRPIREGRLHVFANLPASGRETYRVTLEPRFALVVGDEEGHHRVGDTIEQTVSDVLPEEGMKCVCSKWSVKSAGEKVAEGEGSSVNYQLADIGPYETELGWTTNYWIDVAEPTNGKVAGLDDGWQEAGTTLALQAVPDRGYDFSEWTGELADCEVQGDEIQVPIKCKRSLSAAFVIQSHKLTIGDAGEFGGGTTPAQGDYDYDFGTVVTVTVNQASHSCGATQYVCVGWAATNANPPEGTGPQAVFAVEGPVDLSWQWATNVVTVADAMNASDQTFEIGGVGEWSPLWAEDAADGEHQVRVDGVGNGKTTWIETTLLGPGELSFAWKLAGVTGDKLQFWLDGVGRCVQSGPTGWVTNSVTLGLGKHVVKWTYIRARSGAAETNAVWFDCVDWRPEPGPSFRDALGQDFFWTVSGSANWAPIRRQSEDEPRDSWAGIEGLEDNGIATIETTVWGSGTISFDWKVSCEETWDAYSFLVDGNSQLFIDGNQEDWSRVDIKVTGGPKEKHTLSWSYVKDDQDDPDLVGDNCALLDNVTWTPAADAPTGTVGTGEPMPFDVIRTEFSNYWYAAQGDYDAAAKMKGGNGRPIWESYLIGLDPEDPNDTEFTASISIDADGKPVVTWTPDLNADNVPRRKYTTQGKRTLTDTQWVDMDSVPAEQQGDYKFFRVEVSMPK